MNYPYLRMNLHLSTISIPNAETEELLAFIYNLNDFAKRRLVNANSMVLCASRKFHAGITMHRIPPRQLRHTRVPFIFNRTRIFLDQI